MKNTKISIGAFILVALFSLNSFAAQETQNIKQIAPNIMVNKELIKTLELTINQEKKFQEKKSQEKKELAKDKKGIITLKAGENHNISSMNETVQIKLPSDIQSFKPISNYYEIHSIKFNSKVESSYVTIEIHKSLITALSSTIYTMNVTFEKTASNYNIILTVSYGIGTPCGMYSDSKTHKIGTIVGTIARKK